MAFALWIDEDTAWAAGTHEYRPMGVAVIAATDLFRAGDFEPARPAPKRAGKKFQGLFASLEDVNVYLARSRSQAVRAGLRKSLTRQLSTI
jgi:hypothetical protein